MLPPLLIVRLVASVTATVVVLAACRVALDALRSWRIGATTEGQLVLERRAELASTLVQGALVATIAGFVVALIAADRLASVVHGAMCAYGVLDGTAHGFAALGASLAAALGCALWLALHRLDLRLATPVLTRTKLLALLLLAPLVVADLVLDVTFVRELDLARTASCCSSSLDSDAAAVAHAAPALARALSSAIALTAGLSAIALALATRRRPSALRAYATAAVSLVAAIAAGPAVLFVVGPYAYETPHHLCPFCLLRADVLGLGWPLYAALFLGLALGLALAVVESQRAASGEPAEVSSLQRKLAGWTSIAWGAAIILSLTPIARYLIVSGGVPLFGAS